MKEIQQLRKIAVKLETSGTAIPIAETRLYRGGFGFVILQAYVPVTQNRSPDARPLCTVYRTTLDNFGNSKQFNKDIYNLVYIQDAEIDGCKYMLFERPLPKAFTDTAGDLKIVFNYCEVCEKESTDENGAQKTENVVVSRLVSNEYVLRVEEGGTPEGGIADSLVGNWAAINDLPYKVEQIEDSVDKLLQIPDCTDANHVGVPKVEITDEGNFKFSNLKGEKGDTGAISIGNVVTVPYDKDAAVTNSGTSSDAILNFSIPQGKPAFVKIGNVVTLSPESEARVENVGTENDPIFNFYIPKGDGFRIMKTYASIADMNQGFTDDAVPLYGFVLIDTGNVEDEDNAKLFVKMETEYKYLTDLSGAQGIKGETGEQGIGVQSIEYKETDANNGNVYTVMLTNGNSFEITAPYGKTGTTGNGISYISCAFAQSASATVAPSTLTWSTTIPTTPLKGGYLWTRMKIEYTNGSSAYTYAIAYNGTDGKDGEGFSPTGLYPNATVGYAGAATKAAQDGNGNVISDTYVKKSGDTMIGELYLHKDSGNTYFTAERGDTGAIIRFGIGEGGVNRGIYDTNQNRWVFYTDGTYSYVDGYRPWSNNYRPTALTYNSSLATNRSSQTDTVVAYYRSIDGSAWYRKWASGWKECGGHIGGTQDSLSTLIEQVSLPIAFMSSNYSVVTTPSAGTLTDFGISGGVVINTYAHTVTSFKLKQTYGGAEYSYGAKRPFDWYACGY